MRESKINKAAAIQRGIILHAADLSRHRADKLDNHAAADRRRSPPARHAWHHTAAALFIAIPIVSGAESAFYQYISAIIGRKYSFMINEQDIRSIIKMRLPFHAKSNSGELVAQVGSEASGFILL